MLNSQSLLEIKKSKILKTFMRENRIDRKGNSILLDYKLIFL